MTVELAVTIAAVFISVALISSTMASYVLSRTAPEIKRLRYRPATGPGDDQPAAAGLWTRTSRPLRKPLGRDRNTRLLARLAAAGWDDPFSARIYQASQAVLVVGLAGVPLLILGVATGWPLALVAGVIGYLVPDFVVTQRVTQRKMVIQNSLPDALDLLVVCVEAGSSLDQAILKASEELELALPPMADELGRIASEIRAGKPRLEAFQNLAKRANLEDVRALVAMLIQTDRFGTSIAQALRTHSDALRTKRRQRAEERAGKVGVKLVFPLVLCLLPALYVVCLGPVAVRVYRTLF
jgi:tight adherence protein C